MAQARLDRHAAAIGLPRLTFHQLRHTAATVWMGAGVHPRVVADLLGHSTITQTMRYSHPTTAMHADAAALLGRLLAAPPEAEEEDAAAPAPPFSDAG